MPNHQQQTELLSLYLHLADAARVRRHTLNQNKFLVLSAAMAARMNMQRLAGYCRRLILKNNTKHLVRFYPSILEGLAHIDFQGYVARLEQTYPRERAEHMLQSLKIELGHERDVYFSDEEYFAALLRTTPAECERCFNDLGESLEGDPGVADPPSSSHPKTEMAPAGLVSRFFAKIGVPFWVAAALIAAFTAIGGAIWLILNRP